LDGGVESVFPSLGHCIRIWSSGRVCGRPGRGPYLWEGGGSLTSKEGMNRVVVVMKPSRWEGALRDVIVVIVVTRDGGTVDGRGKGEKKKQEASEGGEHRAGREGTHGGPMTGKGSPYKVDRLTRASVSLFGFTLPSNGPLFPYSLFCLSLPSGAQAQVPLS